jgi:hypothetical protein
MEIFNSFCTLTVVLAMNRKRCTMRTFDVVVALGKDHIAEQEETQFFLKNKRGH